MIPYWLSLKQYFFGDDVPGVLSRQLASLTGRWVGDTRRMKEHASALGYKRHRYLPAIVGHAVWLYCRCYCVMPG